MAAWQAGLLNTYGDAIAGGHLVEMGFFRPDAARHLARTRPGIGYRSLLAFRALCFEKWFDGMAANQREAAPPQTSSIKTCHRRIAVAMTCFNRRETTLACLEALSQQALPADCSVRVYLTDDGCTDGTADSVREAFPGTRILEGDGSLYWNGGMRRALAEAMAEGFDFYLWLNDDTRLAPGAIARLLATYDRQCDQPGAPAIVVGTPANPEGGPPTYGGTVRKHRGRPMRFSHVAPADTPIRCDTFDGNCVLVSAAAAGTLGNLDASFTHLMGDTDYGLRAGKAGIPVWAAAGTIGDCPPNPAGLRHRDLSLPLKERITWLTGVKALPPAEWKVMTRRHAGRLWWVYFLSPYIRFAVETTAAETKKHLRKLFAKPAPCAGHPIRFATVEAVVPEYRMAFFDRLQDRTDIRASCFHGKGREGISVVAAGRPLPVENRPIVNRHWPGGGARVAWQSGLGPVFAGRFDVVMCFETAHNLSVWAVLLFKYVRGYSVVLRGHGLRRLSTSGWREPVRLALRGLMSRMADALVVYSPRCASDTIEAGIAPEKIFVGANTLDTERLIAIADDIRRQRPDGAEDQRPFTLLFLGRLYSRKRVDVLIQAAGLVQRQGHAVRTIIVGDGPERNTLERNSTDIPNVEFHGPEYDLTALARLMGEADLLVMPDAVGLGAVHAFCNSLPILATKEGQSHGPEFDYIDHGRNGILAQNMTPECFAAAIRDLIDRPEYRRSLGDGALATARSLSTDRMVQGAVDAIRYADRNRRMAR